MFKLHKLKYIISPPTLRIVYLSLYQSIIQYGLVIWGGTSKTILNLLKVQKNCVVPLSLKKDNLHGCTHLNYKRASA